LSKTVTVVISSYKGSKNITRQLDSIFEQIDVIPSVFIRDDHSPDDTIDVIRSYIEKYPDRHIEIVEGENEGYAKSFWDALRLSGESDYYAFSDQDDVWYPDKLIKSIKPMEESDYQGPKLSYCKMQRSDESLNRLDEQVDVISPEKLTKKLCLTQTFNYGAATVFNREAKDLICRCFPEQDDIPHDFWAGLLCYWFGKVFYVNEELYYWIRYGTSVTGEGTNKSGRAYRIKKSMNKKSYPNVARELKEYYSDLLSVSDKEFIDMLINYKHSFKSKMKLLFDSSFKRKKFTGTIVLKLGILFNWY